MSPLLSLRTLSHKKMFQLNLHIQQCSIFVKEQSDASFYCTDDDDDNDDRHIL